MRELMPQFEKATQNRNDIGPPVTQPFTFQQVSQHIQADWYWEAPQHLRFQHLRRLKARGDARRKHLIDVELKDSRLLQHISANLVMCGISRPITEQQVYESLQTCPRLPRHDRTLQRSTNRRDGDRNRRRARYVPDRTGHLGISRTLTDKGKLRPSCGDTGQIASRTHSQADSAKRAFRFTTTTM